MSSRSSVSFRGFSSEKGLIVACSFSLLVLLTGCEVKSAPPAPGPPDVTVIKVSQKDVHIYGDWVATLDGFVNATIQPQVSGYLIKQNYHEGSFVHKGDVLFEIDPRPFEAVLAQTQGQVAQAQGQLSQARAQFGLSEINLKRDTPLAQARAIAQSQLDNDIQAKAQNEALIKTNEATIQASEAAVRQAQLNLGFTKVRSLIDGIAGIATTQIGNLVNQTTVLTTVSQVNPIKVYFPISEQEYLRVAGKIKPGGGGDFLRQNDAVPLQLTLSDGSVFPQQGRIIFTDRQVDTQTGTIRVVGAFPNPGNLLRPGQFARVRALTALRKDALLVPQRSITELQGRYQVAVVGSDNRVAIRNVSVGEREGDMWIVNQGLNPNDRVISEGVSKVQDGARVNPKTDTAAN